MVNSHTPGVSLNSGAGQNEPVSAPAVADIAINDLQPAKYKVRKVSNRQIAKIRHAICAFNFVTPILITEEREIIDGHSRVEAARQPGMTHVPCIRVDHLSDVELRALRIVLNKTQETGACDEQVLKLEFLYQLELGSDLSVTGFEIPEIDLILNLDDDGAGDPHPLDRVRDFLQPDTVTVTRFGDIWELGPHRIFCGNARRCDDHTTVLNGAEVSTIFTDHPFNVSIRNHVRVGPGKFEEFAEASGEMSDAEYEDFLSITTKAMLVNSGLAVLCFCVSTGVISRCSCGFSALSGWSYSTSAFGAKTSRAWSVSTALNTSLSL